MNKQEIFEYIRDNLNLTIHEKGGGWQSFLEITFELKLTNPETGKAELISRESISLDNENW